MVAENAPCRWKILQAYANVVILMPCSQLPMLRHMQQPTQRSPLRRTPHHHRSAKLKGACAIHGTANKARPVAEHAGNLSPKASGMGQLAIVGGSAGFLKQQQQRLLMQQLQLLMLQQCARLISRAPSQ